MFPSKQVESGQSSPKSRTSASDMTIPKENVVSTVLAEKERNQKRAKEFETAVKASIGQAGSRRARRGHKLTTLSPADPRLKNLYPEACAPVSEGSVERSPEDRQLTSASPLLLSLSSPDQQRAINTPSELGRRCPIPPTSTSPNDLMRMSSISLPLSSVTPKVDEKDSTEDIESRKDEKKGSPEILSSTGNVQEKLSRPGSCNSTTIQFDEDAGQPKCTDGKSSRASSAQNSSPTSMYNGKRSRPVTAKSARPLSVQDVSRAPSAESTIESRPASVKSVRSPSTKSDMSRISSAKSDKELRPGSIRSTRTPSAKDILRATSAKSENISRPVTGKSRTPSVKNMANSRPVSAKSPTHEISRTSSVVSEQESRPASAESTKMLYSEVVARPSTPQIKKACRSSPVKLERAPSKIFRAPSTQDQEMPRPMSTKSRTSSTMDTHRSATSEKRQNRAAPTCDEARIVTTPSSPKLENGQNEKKSRPVSAASVNGKQESRPVTAASRASVRNTPRAASVQGNQESRPVTAASRASARNTSRAASVQESRPVTAASRASVKNTHRAGSVQGKQESRSVTAASRASVRNTPRAASVQGKHDSRPVTAASSATSVMKTPRAASALDKEARPVTTASRATSVMKTPRAASVQSKQESRPVTALRTLSSLSTSRDTPTNGKPESRPVSGQSRTPSAMQTTRDAQAYGKPESRPVSGKSRTQSVMQSFRVPSTQGKPESRPVTAESLTSLSKNEKKSRPLSANQSDQRPVSTILPGTTSTSNDVISVPSLKCIKINTKSNGAKDDVPKATPEKCNKKFNPGSAVDKVRSTADKDDTRVQGTKKPKQLMDAISTKSLYTRTSSSQSRKEPISMKPLNTRTYSSQSRKEPKQGYIKGKKIPLVKNGNRSMANSTEPVRARYSRDNISEVQSGMGNNGVRPISTDYENLPATQGYMSSRTPSPQRDTKLQVISTTQPQSVRNYISRTPSNQSEMHTESTGQLKDEVTDEKPTRPSGVNERDTVDDKKDIDLVVNGRATSTRENLTDSENKLTAEQAKMNEEEYREFVKSLYAKYKPEMAISGTAFPAPGTIEIDTTKHAIDAMEKLRKKDQDLFENLKRFKKDDADVDKLSRELHEANCLLANLEQDIENLKAQKELNMCMLNTIKNEHKYLLDEKYHLQKQLAHAKKASYAQQNKRKSKEFEQLSLAYDKLDHKEKIMRRRIAMLEAKLSLIISKLDTPKSKQEREAVPPLDLSKLNEKKVLPPIRNAPKAPRKGVNTKSVAEQNFTSFNTGKQHKVRTSKPKVSTSTPSMQNEFIMGRDNRRPLLPAINSQKTLKKPGRLPRSDKQENFHETAVMHVNFQKKSIQVKPKEDTKAEEPRFPDIVKGSQFMDKSKIVPKQGTRKPVHKSRPPFCSNVKPSPYFSSPGR